jgi:hypothetical protein
MVGRKHDFSDIRNNAYYAHMNLLYLFAPLLLPLSPFFFPFLLLGLSYDCTDTTYANVRNIRNINMFKCEIDLYIPSYNHNATINFSCGTIPHNYNTSTHNISIIINKWYQERSCLEIVTSNEDKYITNHDDIIVWYYIFMIEYIILVGGVGTLLIAQEICEYRRKKTPDAKKYD